MPTLVPIESIEIPSSDRLHYVKEYSLARHEYNGNAQMVMNFVNYASPEMADKQEYVFALIKAYVVSRPKAKQENNPEASHLALGNLLSYVNDIDLTDKQIVELMEMVIRLGDIYIPLAEADAKAWELISAIQIQEPFVAPEGLDYNADASVVKYRNLRDEANDMRPLVLFSILGEGEHDKEAIDDAFALTQDYFASIESMDAWYCMEIRNSVYHVASENGVGGEALWEMKTLLDKYEETVRKMRVAKKIMKETAARAAAESNNV